MTGGVIGASPLALFRAELLSDRIPGPPTEPIDCSRNEFLHPHPILGRSGWPSLDPASICRYQPNPRLVAQLATRFDCDPAMLRVHNGAEAALKTIFAALARIENATLLLPQPGWEYHDTLAERYGLRTEFYRYLDEGDARVLDVADLERRIDRLECPAVLIVSPSNPLGARVGDDQLQALARQVSGKGYCIVDQAYFGFAGPATNDWSVGEALDGLPGTILVRTLSKYYGIPGVRVGFTAAHPSVHGQFGIDPDYLGFNIFADEFAVSCLEAHDEFERIAATVVGQRDALAAGLSRIPGFQPFRSDANFLLVRTPGPGYAPWLDQHGVRVRTFTSELADCVRITVPPEPHVRWILEASESFDPGPSGHPVPTRVEQDRPCMHS
ncbi:MULTISPECIES: aminotransferase class I/II-fold pyridoxal phosphate-dependent enzyme [Nocardioides]|uniref:Aminotransferase class I/II-fold pyridoxal phosphate-dependent enzyme n=1 Tax=Nocardioides vastitatis TaxID=2568655 RepID=A0ABW0ZNF5_9ACTN|nr:aminotransferase class I/II-fold pyridoxal phosphate-dependent enzyme [Nocardioides sp.]